MKPKIILKYGTLVVLIIAVIVIGRVVFPDYPWFSIIGCLVVFFFFGLFIRMSFKNKMETLFKNPDVNAILAFYDNTANNPFIPEGVFIKAYTKSLALALYGKFYESLLEMEKFDTSKKAQIFQAMKLNAIVINNYLQKIHLSESLEMAKEAKRLAKISSINPGKEASDNAHDAYIEIGEILNGRLDNLIILSLESRFSSTYFLLKIQIAWALAIAYGKLDKSAKKAEKEKFIRDNAPYCSPLLNFEVV